MGISLGLVGLGAFGSNFAPYFKAHPLVDRIGLCDCEAPRIARFAKDPFFQDKFKEGDAYGTLDEILKSDFDALVIITQPWFHAAQCVRAMESGKHAYSAVPIVTLPDGDEILEWCDRLIKTCERTGKHYMLGETTYYRPQAIYCRRRAAEGAFGDFVYSEGEYFHDVEHGLRRVKARREGSATGKEWLKLKEGYKKRGIVSGPMHYPTHSTSGPICVMKAHAVKVCAWPYYSEMNKEYHEGAPANETALFRMSNGSTMRICEHREIAHPGREMFRVYGSKGSFEHDTWCTRGTFEFNNWNIKGATTPLTADEMREALPPEVVEAFKAAKQSVARNQGKELSAREAEDFYGGHGGSHSYLVHEFVDAVAHERVPAINAWEAARYMAAGVMAHKSALADGEVLDVPDWGDAPA